MPHFRYNKKEYNITGIKNSSKEFIKNSLKFGHIYWRNPEWKTSFFAQCHLNRTSSFHAKLKNVINDNIIIYFITHRCDMSNLAFSLTLSVTAWKVSKYGVTSGPYFSVFGQNTEIYFVNLRIQCKHRKNGPEITPYLDTFYAVLLQSVFPGMKALTIFLRH